MNLGKAAEPAVDLLEAIDAEQVRIRVVEEVHGLLDRVSPDVDRIGFQHLVIGKREDDLRAADIAVERIGSHEVHQVVRVDHVRAEIGPAGVACEVQRFTHVVQRRNPEIPATCDVDRGKVERLTQEPLVERRREELVDLVRLLVRHAQGNGPCPDLGEFFRREEGLFQSEAHDRSGQVSVRVHVID